MLRSLLHEIVVENPRTLGLYMKYSAEVPSYTPTLVLQKYHRILVYDAYRTVCQKPLPLHTENGYCAKGL